MLVEFAKSLMIPGPRWVRRLGFPAELVAIEARHARCRAAWEPHLAAVKAAIIDAAAGTAGRDRVVILGSGLLLDVPIAELAARFAEVVLVDIVQAPWVIARGRRAAGAHAGRLRFMAADVTGGLTQMVDAVLAARAQRVRPAVLPVAVPALALPPADLTVSVMLLSQLHAVPLTWADATLGPARAPTDAVAATFRAALQAAHLRWLAARPGEVWLVTDTERQFHAPSGALVETQVLCAPERLPDPLRGWVWPIAPLGEVTRAESEARAVGVWRLATATHAPAA